MSDPIPTTAGLRQAGQRLAATLRSVPDDGGPGWEPRFPGGPFPEDYVALVSRTGPGTLAGVLRLLAPGCDDGSGRFDGFDIEAERRKHAPPHPEALLWGVCTSGETCWWLPFHDDPARWLVALAGRGHQQLNLTTTEFLDEWLDGRLDLPALSLPPVPRERTLTLAGHPVGAPASEHAQERRRDPLAQLQTIIGPGNPAHYNWAAVERELGVPRLPTDYKRLYEAYGADEQIALNGIFIEHPHDLAAEHVGQTEFLEETEPAAKDSTQAIHHYTVHPEPGGLLYCGSTEGRATLCWDTRDPDPDRWPVVNVGYGNVEEFGPLVDLLVAELTGIGLGLTDGSLGDPATWAWPIWGPRPHRE